jgi:hypothetical protein
MRHTRALSETVSSTLAGLLAERAHACRLTPDRALHTLEDAQAFVAARGQLTLTPDCSLPSLFAACHEEPYQLGGHGFATWPKTKWWWGGALAVRPSVFLLRIHRGRSLYCSEATAARADPLCRAELARASDGEYGRAAVELVDFLAAGPTHLEEIKAELGLEAATLRAVRGRLERVGAIVSRMIAVPSATGGERETSELARWDHFFPTPPASSDTADSLANLVVAGVRAAVVAPEDEIARWYSWPLPRDLLDELVEAERLVRPQPDWVAARSNAPE